MARPLKKAVAVKDLIDKAVSLNNEIISSYGAQCKTHPIADDIIIYADEGQISQILINLIKNALQANAKHIEIATMLNTDNDVIVSVVNDGDPIPRTSREEIFVPFYTTKEEGSGIGLSISRQIMRNHNGSIELARSNDYGTEFRLIFR